MRISSPEVSLSSLCTAGGGGGGGGVVQWSSVALRNGRVQFVGNLWLVKCYGLILPAKTINFPSLAEIYGLCGP